METATLAAALEYAERQLQLSAQFAGRGELRNEARAVLRLAAGVNSTDIFANADSVLDARAWDRVRAIVKRRCAGEPLAYIEGVRGFHAIELRVDRNVLVPRPETEIIVEAVLELAPAAAFTVADLGTGSGAIALALAYARRDAQVVGVDISKAALDVARRNCSALGLDVEWIESDWFSRLGGRRFDFVCCNPPYVRSDDHHLDDLRHEPLLALDGGGDGLEAIREVLARGADHLNPGGRFLLEHGFDQSAEVAGIGTDGGLRLTNTLRDLAGHERVSIFGLPD